MITKEIIDGLRYQIERDLSVASKGTLNHFLYNYPPIINEGKVPKLFRYLSILKKIEEAFKYEVTPCLGDKAIQNLVGLIHKNTNPAPLKCADNVQIDNKGVDAWLLAHPYCATRARWEELAYKICNDLSITFEVIDKSCNLTFDLSTTTLSCDTIAALSVYDKMCELDYTITRTEKECLADYNLLIENHPDCDITYRLYKELIECNLSYDIINQILCDNVNLNIIDGKPTIKSLMGDYVIGSDFSFKQVVAPSRCADTLCKAEGSCTMDYAGFLKRLMSDYNLTKAQKEAILAKVQH